MRLKDLISHLETKEVKGDIGIEIKDIAYDSRKVGEGSLFVAIKGYNSDGHDHIQDAVKRGAIAIVGEKLDHETLDSRFPTAFITVPDSRRALALISDKFYGHPSGVLKLIGITGTNGKTTTSYLIKSILDAAQKKVGLLGTINYIIKTDVILPASFTTPEALELQGYLKDILAGGAEYAVLEVSSHSLALQRVVGCEFEVAIFTNLSRDHLDFHGTMEEYFKAKMRLFDYLRPAGIAVINIDNPEGRMIAEGLKGRVVSFGLSEKAEIKASGIVSDLRGLFLEVKWPEGSIGIESPLLGVHNVHNILAAAGAALGLGISPSKIKEGIEKMKGVPGRFERIEEGQDFTVVVDYAHTEDALRRVLLTARELIKEQRERQGKIITVFGCGGDRDRGKRPKMGEVAASLSDLAIITSDNPRSEDPLNIIKEIERGITAAGLSNYTVLPDRREAISKAIDMAEKGDFILIAGKGHEDYQIIGDKRYPFDDRKVVGEMIKKFKI
jgi:UDP-N-acetylmuramoyl-L-alanyl-D-glutamate--2,6-diaminopimelate ligase